MEQIAKLMIILLQHKLNTKISQTSQYNPNLNNPFEGSNKI